MKIKTLRLDLLNQAVSVPDFTEMLDLDDEQEEATPVSDRVADAVEALPEPMRTVVEMTVWGQYARTEVAQHLGIDPSYVSHLWRRAQEQLGEVLGDLPL